MPQRASGGNPTRKEAPAAREDTRASVNDQVITPSIWPTPTGRDWQDGSAKACRNMAERQSRTSATSQARTGAVNSYLAARWPMRDPWIAYRAFPGAPKHVLCELESDVLGWHFRRTQTAPSCQYRAEHERPDAG
jgi:hypothetical protein